MSKIVSGLTMMIHPRIDVGIDCSDDAIINKKNPAEWELASSVDQSAARASDINVIVATFGKQGIAPHDIPGRVGEFLDNTKIPSFLDAFHILQNATALFNDLPANVRKLMDNDPSQLENFLNDPKNEELLYKEGIFVKEPVVDPDSQPLDRKTFKEVMGKTEGISEAESKVKKS